MKKNLFSLRYRSVTLTISKICSHLRYGRFLKSPQSKLFPDIYHHPLHRPSAFAGHFFQIVQINMWISVFHIASF